MAIWEWVGNAAPVAQVNSFEIAQTTLDEQFGFEINNKQVWATSGGTDNREQVADDLVAAWNANPHPECQDAIASKTNNDSAQPYVVTFTATNPGVPFIVKVAGTSNIAPYGTDVPNEGPNVWGTAGNFKNIENDQYNARNAGSPDSLEPEANDTIHIRTGRPAILYGLTENSLSQRTIAELRIDQVYEGPVGLTAWNSRGYSEYLPTHLLGLFGKINIGQGAGGGCSRLNINNGSASAEVNVYNSGSGNSTDFAAVQIDNLGLTSVATVHGGEVDFFRDSDSAGGFRYFNQLGGTCRVLNTNGEVNMTSLEAEIFNNPRLYWDAPVGGAPGANTATFLVHGGRLEFGPKSVVTTGDGAGFTIDGPATVIHGGGNIEDFVLDHANATFDVRRAVGPVAFTNSQLKRGRILTGDIQITMTSAVYRGTSVFSED